MTVSQTFQRQPIQMFGTPGAPTVIVPSSSSASNAFPYEFTDVDADPAGRETVERVNDGKLIIPVLVFEDGSTLVEPSNADLAAKLGLRTEAQHRFYSLIIVGSGVAGLTAAIYAAREGIATLVIESGAVGGTIGMHRPGRQLPRVSRWRGGWRVRRSSASPGRALRRRDPVGDRSCVPCSRR